MRSLKQVAMEFDRKNPFTYCATNKLITTEKEHILLGIHKPKKRNSNYLPPTRNNFTKKSINKKKSFGSIRDIQEEKGRKTRSAVGYRKKKRKIPVFERLNRQAKGRNREGYFRQLKGIINQNQLEIGRKKDITLSKNINDYESNKAMKKQLMLEKSKTRNLADIDFEKIIAKPKKMSMKNYLSYKRQIFLSIMRQKDIKDNITDMNNLIKEARDELENNFKRKKKLKLEMNEEIKKSRIELEKAKNEAAALNKEFENLASQLTQKNNQINQTANEVTDMEAQVKIFGEYERFVAYIKNIDLDKLKSLVSEEEEIEQEDGYLQDENELFITKQKGVMRNIDYKKMSEKEKKNFLLKDFNVPMDFVDLLRNIESENLYVIQLSQTTKEDKNVLDIQLENLKNDYKSKLKEINDNMRKLKQKNDQIGKSIYEKKLFLNTKIGESSLKLNKNDSDYKETRENYFNVDEVRAVISSIFNQFTPEGADKDLKESEVLKRLLIIENIFEKLKLFKMDKEVEFREIFRRKFLPKRTEKRFEDNKQTEEDKKNEEMRNKSSKAYHRVINRAPMPRTFYEVKKIEEKEDSTDKLKEEELRYFT